MSLIAHLYDKSRLNAKYLLTLFACFAAAALHLWFLELIAAHRTLDVQIGVHHL